MSDSADSKPAAPPAPEIGTSTTLAAFLGAGQRFDIMADQVGRSVYLRVKTPRRDALFAISGARADVEQAVEDMARALAALDAEGAGT